MKHLFKPRNHTKTPLGPNAGPERYEQPKHLKDDSERVLTVSFVLTLLLKMLVSFVGGTLLVAIMQLAGAFGPVG